jgi:large conductance mechanosensitive channel
VVIGGAFSKIVSSLVDNIITPVASVFLGGVDLSSLAFDIGKTSVTYGAFIQAVVDFIIIAFVVFVAIKIMNRMSREEEKKPEEEKTPPTEEVKLLREIRDTLKAQ